MSYKKAILIITMMLLINIYLINAVSYFQTKSNQGNLTTRDFIGGFNEDDGTLNFIKSGRPLEISIKYDTLIENWNKYNYNNTIDYCNFTILYLARSVNEPQLVFNDIFTGDTGKAQYFLRLNDRDGFEAYFDCKFKSNQLSSLEIPVELSLISSTFECKACQFYEWTLTERKVSIASNLQDKTSTVITYIKKLFFLNYEIVVFFFWILLIFLLILSVGMIFLVISWAYKYISRIAR